MIWNSLLPTSHRTSQFIPSHFNNSRLTAYRCPKCDMYRTRPTPFRAIPMGFAKEWTNFLSLTRPINAAHVRLLFSISKMVFKMNHHVHSHCNLVSKHISLLPCCPTHFSLLAAVNSDCFHQVGLIFLFSIMKYLNIFHNQLLLMWQWYHTIHNMYLS